MLSSCKYLHVPLEKQRQWLCVAGEICVEIAFSINDSFHHIPPPLMQTDTQTFTEISFLLLPGLGSSAFELKPAREVRKPRGLH